MTWRRADYSMNYGTPWAHWDDASDDQIEQRVYRAGAKRWPRLTLTTWRRPSGVLVSVSHKDGVGGFWTERDCIPPELIDDAIEMLTAAKARVKP